MILKRIIPWTIFIYIIITTYRKKSILTMWLSPALSEVSLRCFGRLVKSYSHSTRSYRKLKHLVMDLQSSQHNWNHTKYNLPMLIKFKFDSFASSVGISPVRSLLPAVWSRRSINNHKYNHISAPITANSYTYDDIF